MSAAGVLRAVGSLARADFLERLRRTSFLLTLGFAAYLGYLVATGRLVVNLDDNRGVYNSAWVGSLTALVATIFLALVGFYLVKGSIARDRRTGVGEILATTPLTRPIYTLGKTASNFAVLAAMVGVVAAAAVVMQLALGEEGGLELAPLLAPMVWTALPAMAFAAAAAVAFETLPGLRGGFGNVVWFFLWAAILTLPMATGRFDLAGVLLYYDSMTAAARAQVPGYGGGFVIGLVPPASLGTFRWPGVEWTAAVVAGRLAWVAAAIGIALAAALPFDRFDPARGRARAVRGGGGWRARRQAAEAAAVEGAGRLAPAGSGVSAAGPEATGSVAGATAAAAAPSPAGHVVLTPLAAGARRPSFSRLVVAELRCLLAGRNRWWGLAALGLAAAGWLVPLVAAGPWVLAAAWIWPLLVWSSLGSRESEHRTAALLFSSPRPVLLQAPAQWAAGVAVALAMGAGVGARFALAGDGHRLAAFAAGALFVPALALAAGAWSGGAKLFEALYTALWYVGPLNRVPALDFIGTSIGFGGLGGASGIGSTGDAGGATAAASAQRPAVWLLATAVLLALALAGRRRRVRGG